jgi:hypothetical protein
MTDVTLPLSETLLERKGPGKSRPHPRSSTDRASFHMLQLYWSNLDVRLRSLDEATLTEGQRRAREAVGATLRSWSEARASIPELDWDEAYQAERMINLLFGGAQLRQEIRLRLSELAGPCAPEAERLAREYDALLKPAADGQAADDAALRSFLLRVIEALQWNAKKRHLTRPIRKEATKGILACVIVAFLLMVAPYVVINVDFKPSAGLSKWWSLFALYTALVSGLMGAFFSRLIALQRGGETMSLDEAFLHREFSYALLRAGVGMCGALIVYFILRSGIIDGALFPSFDKLAMDFVRVPETAVQMTFVVPSRDLALLTVWCFLAGFSEILVPSVLSGTERRLAEAATPATRPRAG